MLYYQFKSPWLSITAGLLFKGERKVLPEALQADLLLKTQEGHSGRQNTTEKSRGLLQWPILYVNPQGTSALEKKYKARIMIYLNYLCCLPSRNKDIEEAFLKNIYLHKTKQI